MIIIITIFKLGRDPSGWLDQQSILLPWFSNLSCKPYIENATFFLATDIDECSIANECHQNATCHNTKGSYNCTCNGGFKGDGRLNCTGKDLVRASHSDNDDLPLSENSNYFCHVFLHKNNFFAAIVFLLPFPSYQTSFKLSDWLIATLENWAFLTSSKNFFLSF